jgi:hypothetical protein
MQHVNSSVDVDKTKINCPLKFETLTARRFFFHLPRYNASLPARDIALNNTFQFLRRKHQPGLKIIEVDKRSKLVYTVRSHVLYYALQSKESILRGHRTR